MSSGCSTTKPASIPAALPKELQEIHYDSFDSIDNDLESEHNPEKRKRLLQFLKSQRPSKYTLTANQITIHTDIELPEDHSIVKQTSILRDSVYGKTKLSPGTENIQVYLFEDQEKYRRYVSAFGSKVPKRRALFLQNEESLSIYAYIGRNIDVDLRHEITHGYLHSVVPNIPLWVDEGLAEYFELGQPKDDFHGEHIQRLIRAYRIGHWRADLGKLERLTDPVKMGQMEYSESWLWVHFLIHNKEQHYDIWLHHYLNQWKKEKSAPTLSALLMERWPDINKKVETHLKQISKRHQTNRILSPFESFSKN